MRLLLLFLVLLTSCGRPVKEDDDEVVWQDFLPTAPKEDVSPETSNAKCSHVLYLIQAHKTEEAIDELLEARKTDPYLFHEGCLDRLGLCLLEEGVKSSDPQDLLTCLYGAGISQDERTLPILERILSYEEPQLQLVAVAVIASFDTESALQLLEKAMKSNYLFVRLEAAYWLSQKHAKNAHSQLVALMSKIDPQLYELFARLFAIEASPSSQKELKQLLFDQNESVRCEAILAVADSQQDDFLADIRLLASEPSSRQQEAAAYAMGLFLDEASRDKLKELSRSHCKTTALAAFFSLVRLGDTDSLAAIEEAARQGDTFAISLLGSLDGSRTLLHALQRSEENDVRINATIALLKQKDSQCLDGLIDILIDSHRDYTYSRITSHGGALSAWKVTASSSELLSQQPHFFELSLRLREEALIQALELPEEDFLYVARAIFECGQYDLIPQTCRLLENLQSERTIAFLKVQEQRLGRPYVRAWSCLALYRLHQTGPYAETIYKMVEKNEDKEVFQARPVIPWRMRTDETRYQLTLEQSCALLIESFEALARSQDEKGIEMLLKQIKSGNVHNRYTLAGLLMRSSL